MDTVFSSLDGTLLPLIFIIAAIFIILVAIGEITGAREMLKAWIFIHAIFLVFLVSLLIFPVKLVAPVVGIGGFIGLIWPVYKKYQEKKK